MEKQFIPYELGFNATTNRICAKGSPNCMSNLYKIKGREIHESYSDKEYVSFPASRTNFLVAEAIDVPSSATDIYIANRAIHMCPTPAEMEALTPLLPPLKRPLLRHQIEFAAKVYNQLGTFNGNERGLGKTTDGWLLSRIWKSRRIVIVVNKSGMGEWKNQQYDTCAQHYPDGTIADNTICVTLDDPDLQIAHKGEMIKVFAAHNGPVAIVINYAVLDKLKEIILEDFKPDLFICDESWNVKSPNAKCTKAAIEITEHMTEPNQHVLLLNGSPIGNHVGDYWSQVKMIARGGPMENFRNWMFSYANAQIIMVNGRPQEKFIGCRDPVGLINRLAGFYYRATKATCLNLPPKQRKRIILELTQDQKDMYQSVQILGEQMFDPLSLAGEATTLIRLQQVVGGFVPYQDKVVPIDSCKLNWLLEFAEEELKPDPERRVIIWCKFNAEVDLIYTKLKALGINAIGITGNGIHAKHNHEIEEIKRSFNSRDEDGIQVLVCQIKKMAFAHNLQAADDHIKFSYTWSLIEDQQSEDRSHRQGREGAVTYWELEAYIDGKKTVDDKILTALKHKDDLSQRLSPHSVGNTFKDVD